MRTATRSQAGLTLLELIVAVGVLVLVSLATVLQLLSSQNLAHEADHKRIARQAAENEIERIHGLEYDLIAASLVNRTFTVTGLPDRADGSAHGRVLTFLDEDDPDNPAIPAGATGIDLNADGDAVDALAVTDRYRMLPIRIEITYPTRARDRQEYTYRLTTVITPRTFFDD